MGSDIHTRIEYLKCVDGESTWLDGDYYRRNPYYDKTDDYSKKYEVVEICGDRNYQRFSTLADVRNYGDTKPISEPRGIPVDCNKHIKKDYKSWGCDAHSASWFTLKELLDYQNNQPVSKFSGYISQNAAYRLDKENIVPEEWCQGTSDTTWVFRKWECKSDVLIPLIDDMKERLKEIFYLWDDERIIEFSDKIRVVFWFDN